MRTRPAAVVLLFLLAPVAAWLAAPAGTTQSAEPAPRVSQLARLLDAGTIVFGHDAPGGLVRVYREGESEAAGDQPCLLGLDTGCVYGGRLSAWLLEERRLVQVDSERVWFGSARG